MDIAREQSDIQPANMQRAVNTTQMGVAEESIPKNPDATVLGMPAELRNRIYEAALIEEGNIFVDSNTREPSLLLTCRQIRSEAIKIWYIRNTFEAQVSDCNGDLCGRFYRHSEQYGDDKNGWPGLEIRCEGSANWGSLLRWCKEIHKEENFRMTGLEVSRQDALTATLIAAHTVAMSSRSGTWEDCEEALAAVRQLAAHTNSKWLDD